MSTALTVRSDADLVEAARAGDRTGFSELYERYSTNVHDFALRLTRSAADAADVTQDTFVTALERLDQLRDPSRFRSWVFQIAYRRALDGLSAGRRTQATDDERVLTQADPDRLADPSQVGEVEEVAEFVWQVAATLDPTTYTLLDLHVRRDLGSRDIADVLDVTPNTASQQLHRMRQTVEAAMLTFLLARKHRKDCADLDHLLYGTGDLSPELRREVDAHVETCDGCRRRRRALIAPLRAFAALAAVEAPPRVAAAVGRAMDAHFGTRPWWRRGAAVIGMVLFLVIAGTGVGIGLRGGSPDDPALAGESPSPSLVASTESEPGRSPSAMVGGASETASEASPSPTPSEASTGPVAGPPTPATSPTPVPTASPTPTPTPSATPTASATPTPTPTPTDPPTPPANDPPEVVILRPAQDTSVCPETRVVLEGDASDPEGAILADSAFRWTLDGAPAGTGRVVVTEPAIGVHDVVLSVRDPGGATGTATRQLTVREPDHRDCFRVDITSPEDGATFFAQPTANGGGWVTVKLTAEATHANVAPSGLRFVWFVDGQDRADGPEASARLQGPTDCRTVVTYEIRVEAIDPDGTVVDDRVTVAVRCPPT